MHVFFSSVTTLTGSDAHPASYQGLSLGVRQSKSAAHHLHPSNTKVKNVWSYISTLSYVFMVQCLIRHRDNFTITYGSEKYHREFDMVDEA